MCSRVGNPTVRAVSHMRARLPMAYTVRCFKFSGAVSASSEPFHAARARTRSARYTKVRTVFSSPSSSRANALHPAGSVGLVSRFGQFYKSVDPGLVQVNVCTESLRIVDVKIQISPIGRQKVITRDNVDVEMCVSVPSLQPSHR